MSSTIQFISTSPTDLITELKNSLIPELTAQLSAQFQPKQPTEYLTRSEVCKLLKIDMSSLHRWRKEGKIPSYGLGNRVYFKRSEVEQIINKNKLS
ncbi:helix-turn-helix domain-containing protein [Epilithonimonas hispanica]|uniref:DNA-binding protein n=1 Tax=Epilithonimonas hispanica TaxID=358687 RepID=A0A3D9CX51_9FLAO|nr:helix-turn-helix domain-containing protein [Epilithonimonas hispanica]REC70228.1 DNA-binding protein [Epilithonimonas hispanica]